MGWKAQTLLLYLANYQKTCSDLASQKFTCIYIVTNTSPLTYYLGSKCVFMAIVTKQVPHKLSAKHSLTGFRSPQRVTSLDTSV